MPILYFTCVNMYVWNTYVCMYGTGYTISVIFDKFSRPTISGDAHVTPHIIFVSHATFSRGNLQLPTYGLCW